MRRVTNLFLFLIIIFGASFFILTCQTNSDDSTDKEAIDEVVKPLGLIEDEDGNLHLPLDFSERYPLLADKNSRNKRLSWFNAQNLGFYPDMGLHSHIGREFRGKGVNDCEWLLCIGQIPPADYEAMAKDIDLTAFNIGKFVQRVVDFGAGYVVLNAKHFDGFSMFNSAFTEYDIIDATDKKYDLYAKLIPALKAKGIKIGFHYSIMDWYHESQANFDDDGNKQIVDFMTKIDPEKKDEYIKFVEGQVGELIDKYQADLFWFDGAEWLEWWDSVDGWNLQSYILKKNPNIIVNDRIGDMTKFDGDFSSFDKQIPPFLSKYKRDWEVFYKPATHFGYSRKQGLIFHKMMLRKYVDSVSRGGNLLIKFTLNPEVQIEKRVFETFEKVKPMVRKYKKLLLGATPAPKQFWPTGFGVLFKDWRRFVIKDDKLYLFAFYNPGSKKIQIPEMENKIYTKAYYLSDPSKELQILNMNEVLEERAKSFVKSQEEAKDIVKDTSESDNDQEEVPFNIEEENIIYDYSDIEFNKKDFNQVELLKGEWPKGDLVVIAIEYKSLSSKELLDMNFEKIEKETEVVKDNPVVESKTE